MKKNLLFAFAIVLVASLMVSCGGGGGGAAGNSPSKSVENLFDNLKSENYDKAASAFYLEEDASLSDSESQKIKALLMAANEEYEKKGGIKDIEILEENVSEDGTSGKVKFKVIYGNGDEDNENYNVKKIDGDWKLQAISGF